MTKLSDYNFIGATELADVKGNELNVLGPLTFNNIEIEGNLDVIGSIHKSNNGIFGEVNILGAFEAANVTCKSLDVAGMVNVAGLRVYGDSNIVGSVTIRSSSNPDNSNVLQNMNVYAESINLHDVQVNGDITIQPTLKNKALKWFDREGEQVLTLAGQTVVNGNITFVSGKGKIMKDDTSCIKGNVLGAI